VAAWCGAPNAIEVEIPSGCQRGALWVEIVGKRLDGKAISLERERMNNRVVAMMGKSVGSTDNAISSQTVKGHM
jgi:hypothetical protein